MLSLIMLLKNISPILLSDFDSNTFSAYRRRSFCDSNFYAGNETKKIISIVIKKSARFSLHIVKLHNDCINVDFINQIFNCYRKGIDYASQNLDIENKVNKN